VVTELKKKFAFDVEIVKKTSFGLMQRMSLPKFPAVEIDGTVVFEGRDIMVEELEREIAKRVASQGGV
jgi:hypothetical protein